MAKKRNKRSKQTLAERADRHQLYQATVQNVEAEIDFVDDTFKKLRKRRARLLREDFCGTANTSCEWVRRRKDNRAIGVDIDPDVLEWGQQHNIAKLKPHAARRVSIVNGDVMQVETEPVDIVLAMNFSYWFFKERAQLRRYFRRAYDALKEDGIFFLDAYGGYDSYRELREKREGDGYTYIWDQASYNPITGDTTCHIHFKFPDGSRLKKAFSYTWRMWTLPEIREILLEAGFENATVYWDVSEDDDVNDYQPTEHGTADAGWVCYLVAEK